MKRLMTPLTAVALMLLWAGCEDNPVTPEDTLPQPQAVAANEIEEPVAPPPGNNTDADAAVYYYIYYPGQNTNAQATADAETLLEDLLENGVRMENAWDPILDSRQVPCGAPNVHPALVVQLEAPNDQIRQYGFVNDPSTLAPPVYPNCDIEEFEHYAF